MTTVHPTELSEEVGVPLYRALVRLSRRLRSTTPAGELTLTKLSTLAVVQSSGSSRVTDLASKLGIAAATTSRMIDSLGELGLVERTPDPDDQRATRVTITASGEAALERLHESGTAYLDIRLAELGEAELKALVAALPALEQLAVNEIPGPAQPHP
ncbi:MAG: transcriptional regulator, MarR family [Amycolatopsis sp.]|jgi:DNA-binding MarR family transcriptional regulator|uniref:MarR family winged helix-turn-helix transcriptional regulator n=1 Tax=Amycolatopsis sp. TaxID=37632 RepID=UPI002625F0AF|nr:MarR family transcriptional regulator [Amycolatopsis sp.]MCU1679427.1 transcriptional regulator, MarR family [Amycolatopsis sp.]